MKTKLLIGLLAITLSARAQEDSLGKRLISAGLTDIQKADPHILVELKYSTTDNFVKKDVYGDLTRAFMQPEMAKKLAMAETLLENAHPGYRLLVYDAARPNAVQFVLWNALDALGIPQKNKNLYVAEPKEGSIHNFGCAVDLTVADSLGTPLDMGTPYDYFGPLAYPTKEKDMLDSGKLSSQHVENRQILRAVMTSAGFAVNPTEWWHFDGLPKDSARIIYKMIP